MVNKRKCNSCNKILPSSEFRDDKHYRCKSCTAIVKKQWRLRNKEHNNDYHKQYNKSERGKERYKRYVNNNRDKVRAKNNRLAKRRVKTIQVKLARNLRNRLWYALKGRSKSGSAVRDLGCSIEQLKIHLESQFQSDMSWDNYGQYRVSGPKKWTIDHVVPMDSVDLTNKEELLRVCNYTNLQPMWSSDNSRKCNRW